MVLSESESFRPDMLTVDSSVSVNGERGVRGRLWSKYRRVLWRERNTSQLVQHIGTLVHTTLVHLYYSTLVHTTLVHWCYSTLVLQYTGTLVLQYTGTHYIGTLVHTTLVHWYYSTPILHYGNCDATIIVM